MANVRKYGMVKPCRPNGGVDLRWQRKVRRKCAEDRNVLSKNVTDINVGNKKEGTDEQSNL